MASGQQRRLVSVNYDDLRTYQSHYKEIIKQNGTSFGKRLYLVTTSQMIWGFVCLTIGIFALVRNCDQSGMRIGIWSGVMYMFGGIVGLVAAANTDHTVVMCYMLASLMTLTIAVTALCLEGQNLPQSVLDGVVYECVMYSSALMSFSLVEAVTSVTAIILSYMLGKGSVSHQPLPDLQVYDEMPDESKEPSKTTSKSLTTNPISEQTYKKQFL